MRESDGWLREARIGDELKEDAAAVLATLGLSVLIDQATDTSIVFVRAGTHADLFE